MEKKNILNQKFPYFIIKSLLFIFLLFVSALNALTKDEIINDLRVARYIVFTKEVNIFNKELSTEELKPWNNAINKVKEYVNKYGDKFLKEKIKDARL